MLTAMLNTYPFQCNAWPQQYQVWSVPDGEALNDAKYHTQRQCWLAHGQLRAEVTVREAIPSPQLA